GPAPWALSIQRTPKEGPFEAGEKPALIRLSQRLTEVASLSAAVGRIALSSAIDALNAVRQPAVAIDRLGAGIDANVAAEALFEAKVAGEALVEEGIRIKDRRLLVADADARRATDALLDRLRAMSDLEPFPCDPLIVRRRDKGPVILRMLPIPGAARTPFLGA